MVAYLTKNKERMDELRKKKRHKIYNNKQQMKKCKVGLIGNYFVNWLILNPLKLKLKRKLEDPMRQNEMKIQHTGMF